MSTYYGPGTAPAIEINPGLFSAKNQQASCRTKNMTVQTQSQPSGTVLTQTSGRLLYGAITFQRTPVSFLQDQRPGPQRPCRSRSPRSAFQAFLEGVSPSLFHRWINRVKSAFPLTTAICGGPYRTQFWIPWLDSCFCDASQVLQKALNSQKEHFLLPVYSPLMGVGFPQLSRHNLPTVNGRPPSRHSCNPKDLPLSPPWH